MIMKLNKLSTWFLLAALTFLTGTVALTQEHAPGQQRPAGNQPRDIRANALRHLGLSRHQIQMMRRLNAERKPAMDAAQIRVRLAMRALDEAIYSDKVNEAEFDTRLAEFQAAQAEVQRIRFMNEFAVRRILTPEQLLRFREIRRRFDQARPSTDAPGSPLVRPATTQRPIGQSDSVKPRPLGRFLRRDQEPG